MADYSTASLIDDVLEDSNDSSIPRTRILRYLQAKHDEVLGRHRFKFNEDAFTEIMSEDTVTVSYDSDFQQIIDLTITDEHGTTSRPDYIAPDQFFEWFPLPDTNTAGRPSYYTDYGGEIYWDRPLDAEYTATVRYTRAPKRLEDATDDIPNVPEEFKDILTVGGLAKVERSRGNFDIAGIYDRQCEDLSENMLGRYGLRKRQPGKVRTTRTRGGEI